MAIGNDSSTGPFSEMHWKSLRYFNLYRFCIAFLLFSSSVYRPSSISILSPESESLHLVVTTFYLLATTVSLVGLLYYRRRFNMQLSLNVLVDVLVLTLLMHTGGLRSGLGVMMLVTLAGAGLVGQGRLVLLYAALATLTVLAEQSYRAIVFDFEMVDFSGRLVQRGVLRCGDYGAPAGSTDYHQRRTGSTARHRSQKPDIGRSARH